MNAVFIIVASLQTACDAGLAQFFVALEASRSARKSASRQASGK